MTKFPSNSATFVVILYCTVSTTIIYSAASRDANSQLHTNDLIGNNNSNNKTATANGRFFKNAFKLSTASKKNQEHEHTNKRPNLIQRLTHETVAPSVVGSFYNLFNNGQDLPHHQQQIIQSDNKNANDNLPTYDQIRAQQQTNQQSTLDQGPVALGSELMIPPQMKVPNYPGQYMVGGGDNPSLMEPSTAYDQTLAIHPNQDNVVARLYVDPMGNQQLVPVQQSSFGPNEQPDVQPRGRPIQYASSDAYGAQQNPYGPMNFYMSPQHSATLNDQAQTQRITHPKLTSDSKATVKIEKDHQEEDNKREEKKNRLTNAQLVALIDELKEFNDQQASKVPSTTTTSTNDAQDGDGVSSPEDNDPDFNDDHVDGVETEPKGRITKELPTKRDKPEVAKGMPENIKREPVTATTPKPPSSEELAKFAKFLMSKEGANMKYELGLEKDSPDDGDDDDDRDTLLEAKNKLSKEFPKELAALDKQNTKVLADMDQVVNHLASKTEEVNRSKRLKKLKRDPDDEDWRARGRRDNLKGPSRGQSSYKVSDEGKQRQPNPSTSEQMSVKNPATRKPKRVKNQEPSSDSNYDGNFAKMLIQQEMMQDKLDADKNSAGEDPTTTNDADNSNNSDTKDSDGGGGQGKRKSRRSSEDHATPAHPEAQVDEGSKNYKYPKRERNKDHIALIHELQKARGTKSKLRSRIPIGIDPMAQSALNGELGVRAEAQPDGNLLLHSNRDPLLRLRLPQTTDNNNNNGDESSESDARPSAERDHTNAEHDPAYDSSSKDTKIIDRVSLKSAQPVKDEYPVSERVSERLNKLSQNLDRYFNDGFLQEIESKAQPNGNNQASIARGRQTVDAHQTESSNQTPEKVAKDSGNGNKGATVGGVRVDRDFDVDVDVSGKRDDDKDDDYADDKDDDERGNKKGSGGESDKQSSRRQKGKVRRRNHGATNVVSKENVKPTNSESNGGRANTALSAGRDNLEFENQAQIVANLDPVDSETLDTAIGPDNTEPDTVHESSKKVRRYRTSDKMSTKYGNNSPSKFYEEPEW